MAFRIQPSNDTCRGCNARKLRLFCNLNEEALNRFDQLGMIASFSARTTIFREGDKVLNVFVVCDGRIKLSMASCEGRTMILRLAGPGDVLGMSAALSGQRHEVTAETLEPTQLKSIRRDDFIRLFQDFPEVGQKTAQTIALEYRAAYLDARRLALAGSASAKLAQLFLEWAGESDGMEASFKMTLTHEELGNICGMTRETVTRMLHKLESDGLVVRKGASIRLPNVARLNELAAEG